tara:strand:+ start:120 stop:602 length:483 start_codon:yes stop_codon:yes gene_type:complete
MASKSLNVLKTANRNFDNILDSYLNLTDGGTVAGAVTFTSSPIFNGRIREAITLEDVDAQNLTITAARFLKGLIVHTSVTGAGTATLDTGVNLIAGLGLTAVGQAMTCTYVNDGNQTVTFAVATGTTITNVANTVLTNASCTLICRMTAAATVDVTIANN